MIKEVNIELSGLPKISLNKWYAGTHWTQRKKIKDDYKVIVYSQHRETYNIPCDTEYVFMFKSRPLDASNCVAMAKMIEDILFPNDGYKIVRSVKYSSIKGNEDRVKLKIKIL